MSRALSLSSRVRQFLIKHRIGFACSLPKRSELCPALFQICINFSTASKIEGDRAVYLLESQPRERLSNALRRLAVEECINHGIKRHPRAGNAIGAIDLSDIVFAHVNSCCRLTRINSF